MGEEGPLQKKFKVTMTHTVEDAFANQIGDIEQSVVELSWPEAFLCCGLFEFGMEYHLLDCEFVKAYHLFYETQKRLQHPGINTNNVYPKKKSLRIEFLEPLEEQSCTWNTTTKKITGLKFKNINKTITTPKMEDYLDLTICTHIGHSPSVCKLLIPMKFVCDDILKFQGTIFLKKHNLTKQDITLLTWIKQIRTNHDVIQVYKTNQQSSSVEIPCFFSIKRILIVDIQK